MKPEKENPAANGAWKFRHIHPSKLSSCTQSDFRVTMSAAGLLTKAPIIPDGRLHRFHVEGDKLGSKNGFYVLYGDGVPAGAFGCWKRGISETWCAKPDRELTQAQREENRHRMIAAQEAREAEEAERRRVARDKALLIWESSPLAPDDHYYLVKKGVRNHGLRLHRGLLVIPMRDSSGNLHSLQFIDGAGNKRFLSGGRKKGCYFAVGSLLDRVCITEGYSTGASVYEATGYAVAVAFDAGNLLPVAQALRADFPRAEIILCADNDIKTPGKRLKFTTECSEVAARNRAKACHSDYLKKAVPHRLRFFINKFLDMLYMTIYNNAEKEFIMKLSQLRKTFMAASLGVLALHLSGCDGKSGPIVYVMNEDRIKHEGREFFISSSLDGKGRVFYNEKTGLGAIRKTALKDTPFNERELKTGFGFFQGEYLPVWSDSKTAFGVTLQASGNLYHVEPKLGMICRPNYVSTMSRGAGAAPSNDGCQSVDSVRDTQVLKDYKLIVDAYEKRKPAAP